MLESDEVVLGEAGAGQAAAVAAVGGADLAGVGSPPPPTRAKFSRDEGAPELTCTVKVTVAVELAGSGVAAARSQIMLGAVTVQVKALTVNGYTPLKVSPAGNTSTSRTMADVAAPPTLLTASA